MAANIRFVDDSSVRVFVDTTYDSEIDNVEDESDDETSGQETILEKETASKTTNTKQQRAYRWRCSEKHQLSVDTDFSVPSDTPDADQVKTPLQYFKDFFDDDMIELISDQTNLYSTQNNIAKGSIATNANEIQNFLGILLRMCVVQVPKYRMYWETATRYEPVASIMSRNRFKLLKKNLHFVDNQTAPQRDDPRKDKLFKIRPLFEMLRQNCLKVSPEEVNSVDEQMIPFKGRSSLRRYLPNKPKKWGFKIFSRNGSSGICYDFELDGAPNPDPVPVEKLGYHGADVVMRLCHHLPKGQNYKLFFDNFFNYLELLIKLKEEKIWAVGTLRADRMRGCKLKGEKELKKSGRGSYDGAVDFNSGITVVRWFDNRQVQLASNYAFINPVDTVRRFSKADGAFIEVSRPVVVKLYNADMGGVDLFDMFRALYSLDHKSKRWYMKIFFWVLATAAINGWLMYRRHCDYFGVPKKEQLPLLQFISHIADAIISTNNDTPRQRKRGRPSLDSSLDTTPPSIKIPRKAPDLKDTPAGIRFDATNHWPIHRPDRPRCMVCKEKTRLGCRKCKKGLCITENRNCYLDYHNN